MQPISLGVMKKWRILILDIEDAFLQADGFVRAVNVRAPCEWNAKDTRHVRKFGAPACGLNDAPVAPHWTLRKYSANPVRSPAAVGLGFEVSSSGPSLFFVIRKSGGAFGATATHIDDISGCGEPELLSGVWRFSEKGLGESSVQEKSVANAGMELVEEDDFSVTLTQEDVAKNMTLPPAPPTLWADRKGPLSVEETKICRCKLGEL